MKNKKGFTLVELLAVIVVLGIIMAVAGTAGLKIKKDANIETAKKLEQTLTDLGTSIYSYENTVGVKDARTFCKKIYDRTYFDDYSCFNKNSNGDKTDSINVDTQKYKDYFYYTYKNISIESNIRISLDELNKVGYLKSQSIKNPSGSGNCNGYLEIKKTAGGPEFKGFISCADIYESAGYSNVSFTSVKLTAKGNN